MKNWFIEQQLNWTFLDQQDFIQDLAACEQDSIWHAEGNVYVHTKMVIDALLQLPEYQQCTPNDQYILQLAALLHDIAKPQCTFVEDGRIVSPRHAKVGEKVTRDYLWDMPFGQRETVCSLVRLHGLPLWSLDKPNPNREVIASSWRVRNELIYIIAKADVLGRICQDQAELLERAEYFKELCLENNCYTAPRTFYNEHSRFKFFQNNDAYPADRFDDTAFEVIILSGIAGSGKDTYAATLDMPMVSLDDLRIAMKVKRGDTTGEGHVVQRAYQMAKTYAAHQQSFVWNSTNITADMRAKIINALLPYNPKFKIVYLETSVQNVFNRRQGEIPRAALQKMYRSLDLPQYTEAHEVVYIRQ